MARLFRATVEDIPRILPCAREYTDTIPDMEFDADHYVEFWRNMLITETGVIFLHEDDNGGITGGIGGVKLPEPLSGRMTAVEMFWYTAKGKRGAGVKLYLKFKEWAKQGGCKRLAMIFLPHSMPEELHQFYSRDGLRLAEMHYEGELK